MVRARFVSRGSALLRYLVPATARGSPAAGGDGDGRLSVPATRFHELAGRQGCDLKHHRWTATMLTAALSRCLRAGGFRSVQAAAGRRVSRVDSGRNRFDDPEGWPGQRGDVVGAPLAGFKPSRTRRAHALTSLVQLTADPTGDLRAILATTSAVRAAASFQRIDMAARLRRTGTKAAAAAAFLWHRRSRFTARAGGRAPPPARAREQKLAPLAAVLLGRQGGNATLSLALNSWRLG